MKNFLKSRMVQAAFITGFLGLIGIVLLIISQQPIAHYAPQTMSDSPGATQIQGDVSYTEVQKIIKKINYSKEFSVSLGNLRTLNKELFNVKFELPNNKEAFLEKMTRWEGYTVFHANDDLSDIYIPENYIMTEEMEKEVCWIVELVCDRESCGNSLNLGPKGILEQGMTEDSHTCYKR